MARTQARDYAQRRDIIIENAARLYAERGFLGASIADLADICGMSKSLIYHYYPSKEDILFDVMFSHVRALLDVAEFVTKGSGSAVERLQMLTAEFLRLYVGAAARHKVLLNEIPRLSAQQREVVVGLQQRLIDIVHDLLLAIRPDLAKKPSLGRPAAMLYFGMINWTHTWLDPAGRATPEQVANLASGLFIDGIGNVVFPR